jgi:hypothetical protein
MDAERRRELLDAYAEGTQAVADAVAGLTPEDLDRRPTPASWTAREICHHLADSEMTSAIRLRRLIAEDDPIIHGYDEGAFAKRLFYDRPVEASLDAMRGARASSAEILERLGEDQWARAGTHTESGAYSIEIWLEIYARHGHDHAGQIRRAARGEP